MCSLYRNEYRNLKLAGSTMGRGLERSKRTDRDVPVGVVIHICMETTQENSLSSYLYLKLAKIVVFVSLLIIYVFFFYKIGEQEERTGSAQEAEECGGRRVGTGGKGAGG
jgi:Ca2+/Na+ antiporter